MATKKIGGQQRERLTCCASKSSLESYTFLPLPTPRPANTWHKAHARTSSSDTPSGTLSYTASSTSGAFCLRSRFCAFRLLTCECAACARRSSASFRRCFSAADFLPAVPARAASRSAITFPNAAPRRNASAADMHDAGIP